MSFALPDKNMIKKQVQKIVLVLIAFFSIFLFCNCNTAFALDAFEAGHNNPQVSTGLFLTDTGFDENGLFFEFFYSGSYSSELYSLYDNSFDVTTFYFPAFYSNWVWYTGLKLKDFSSGQSLIINEFNCSNKVYYNNDSHIEKAWCALNETSSIKVYAKSIMFPSEYGTQYTASNGFAFSETEIASIIPDFFDSEGLSILELNAMFFNTDYSNIYDPDSWFWSIPNGENISSLFGGGAPEPINATCGLAHGETFTETPTENLCAIGSLSNLSFTPRAYYLTSTWNWTCLGENGGIDRNHCMAYLDDSVVLDGVCGPYSEQTFDTLNDFKVWDYTDILNKCSVGAYAGESVSTTTNKIYWYCSGVNYGESVSCNASFTQDLIFDDFDISGGDIIAPSFDEGETNKNWFISALTYLFTPKQETLQTTFNLIDKFKTSVPFGYFYYASTAINGFIDINELDYTPPRYEMTFTPGGDSLVVFDYDDFVRAVGIDNYLIFYKFFNYIFAILFIYYVISRAKKFIDSL